jgi:hypothetical protein
VVVRSEGGVVVVLVVFVLTDIFVWVKEKVRKDGTQRKREET